MSLAIKRSEINSAAKSFVARPHDDVKAVESFFDSLETPIATRAKQLFSSGKHIELLDLDVDPVDYAEDQSDLFHRDYLAVKFLSKSSSLKTGYDLKARGFAKFFLMEEQCKETNHRFKSYQELENSSYATWLFVMRRKIDVILGDFEIEEFFDSSSWGPGVTTLIKGMDTSATRKFQSETGITNDAYALMGSSLASAFPGWFREERLGDSSVTIQQGNTITSVPKNSKTDRIIAVEPGLNLYFQKGVGAMIKRRLKVRGINLTDQSKNQNLAKIGSLTGRLATVDFSSASDTIALNLVHKILPDRWYAVLNALRSKVGLYEGKEIRWEKFSSMGNGFTFELESLIFYAAALTTCEMLSVDTSEVSVYGDDVIIPSSAFISYEEFCKFLGFTVNVEKSYSTGNFRESCGAHFFSGFDVKPIFHKESLTDAFSVFKLANSIRRLSHRRSFNCGCDRRFLDTWRSICQRLPRALRSLRIPENYGDGGLISNFDEACPTRHKNGWEGYKTLSLAERSVKRRQDCHGLLQERLCQIRGSLPMRERGSGLIPQGDYHRLSELAYGNETPLRGQSTSRVSVMSVPSWYNLGSWE